MGTKTIIEMEVKAGRRSELLEALEEMHEKEEGRARVPGLLKV